MMIFARLRRIELTDAMIGGVIGFLIACAMLSFIQFTTWEMVERNHIEATQLAVSDAVHEETKEARKFRDSLFCAAWLPLHGCLRWEPRVKP